MSPSERSHMRPFGELAPFSEVRRTLEQLGVAVGETEQLSLLRSAGRTLATAVCARVDVPNADRAAMDGHAAKAQDTAPDTQLRIVGRVAAGQDAPPAMQRGECVEVATGAPLPLGADCVIPIESSDPGNGAITVRARFLVGQHISRRADDVREGESLALPGATLQPSLVAACAAAGIDEVEVWRRPRVLVVSSGDEIVPAGSGPLRPGQVYDSNATALAALFHSCGATVERTPIIRDERPLLEAALTGTDADLVVTIGGTSVGRRDLVSDVVAELGDICLHGVAVRPGKPLLLARIGERPLIGLPGFPTSCLMMAYVTAKPLLERLGHVAPSGRQREATLGVAVDSPRGKTHFLPVRINAEGEAIPTFTFSSAVSSMARADGWIEIAAEVETVPVGSSVCVTLY